MASTVSHVRVVVTVEVTTGATYGEEWNLGDLRKQVKGEAVQMLRNQLKHHLIRVIDEPRVIVVASEEAKA